MTDDGKVLNHILKLSPAALEEIGIDTLRPSCLAITFLASSFFRQCGADEIFHIGVITPKDWPFAASVSDAAKDLLSVAQKYLWMETARNDCRHVK